MTRNTRPRICGDAPKSTPKRVDFFVYTNNSIVTFGFNVDLTTMIRFSKTFGLFAGISVGYSPLGTVTKETVINYPIKITTTNDWDLDHSFIIVPSIGFAWVF